jgi:hypothetical protein
MQFDYYEHDEDEQALQNYNYDLGYYEGLRNCLQLILHHMQGKKSEKKKIELLLFAIKEELDDAIRLQKSSEKRFFDTKEQY